MDSPPASPPPRPTARLVWSVGCPLLGFLFYAAALAYFMGSCAGGSDSSGYLNNARLLGQGRLVVPMRLLPGLSPETLPSYTHVPLGFVPNADHVTMTPTYPMGLPVLILAAARVVGWDIAPGLVMLLQALFGLWLVHRLARESGLEEGWSWLGTLLLAASPLYFFTSLQVMSDTPAMAWVAAAVAAAWTSRRRPRLALIAGLALSIAVMARPSDMLGFLPVGLALGLAPRRWLLLILGGLPGAIFLGVIHHTAYGSVFTTGYGNIGSDFGLDSVLPTLGAYARWLPVLLTPLCLLAAGLPALRRDRPPISIVLAAWALIFPGFYLFYSITHTTWWYMRFVLPSFPPIIIIALLVLRRLLSRFKIHPRPWWLAPATAALAIYSVAWCHQLKVYTQGKSERVYLKTAAWVRERLPANAVIAAMQTSGALFYYTDLTLLRWDMVSPADFDRMAAACTAAGRPLYAVLFPFEIEDAENGAFKKHLTGHWTQIGAVRYVSIWKFDSPSPSS